MSWAKYVGYQLQSKVGLVPASITTDGNGTGFDRLTYSHMLAVANAKVTSGSGTIVVKVQDSADNSTGWADYSPSVLFDGNATGITTAAFPTISTDGIMKLDVDLSAAKRYIRFVKTTASSPTIVLSVDALLGQRDGTAVGEGTGS